MILNNNIKCFYTIEKLDSQKNVIESFSFRNLITSYGSSFLYAETTGKTKDKGFYYCSVGDSPETPVPEDTTLKNQKGIKKYTSAPEAEVTSSYGLVRWTYEWDAGAFEDVNIKEIGIGELDTGESLISRSLVKDDNGNLGTLNIRENESLRVIYELRIYPLSSNDRETKSISLLFQDKEKPGEIVASLNEFSDTGLDAVNHVLGSDKGLCYGEDICAEINRTDQTEDSFSIERTKNDDNSYTFKFTLPVYNAPDPITKINFYSQTYPYGFILSFPEPITIKDNEELNLVIKKSLKT